jgi:hypothetical protein
LFPGRDREVGGAAAASRVSWHAGNMERQERFGGCRADCRNEEEAAARENLVAAQRRTAGECLHTRRGEIGSRGTERPRVAQRGSCGQRMFGTRHRRPARHGHRSAARRRKFAFQLLDQSQLFYVHARSSRRRNRPAFPQGESLSGTRRLIKVPHRLSFQQRYPALRPHRRDFSGANPGFQRNPLFCALALSPNVRCCSSLWRIRRFGTCRDAVPSPNWPGCRGHNTLRVMESAVDSA